MTAPDYICSTEGAVTLTAATAKSIIGVKGHANSGLLLKKATIGFLGVLSTSVPVLVELCYSTWASNSPGTNSTSTTPRQTNGRVLTAGFTSGKTWTAEPTTLTVLEDWPLTPNGGLVIYDLPLSTEWDTALGEGFVIRCNAPVGVDVRSTLKVNRC